MSYRVRLAIASDVVLLGEIERAAGVLFPPGRIPDPEKVTDLADFEEARGDGLLFIAELDGTPVGFALCSFEAERIHLYELAVNPAHGRRGLGRRLVQAVIDEATARGVASVSLTTFADLAWNRPFYESMQFETIAEQGLDPFLRNLLAGERAAGLTQRVAMIRPVAQGRART